jgi:hypothetical protein
MMRMIVGNVRRECSFVFSLSFANMHASNIIRHMIWIGCVTMSADVHRGAVLYSEPTNTDRLRLHSSPSHQQHASRRSMLILSTWLNSRCWIIPEERSS